uniref:HIT domain-containing protein n=1 Tax=Megaselia scalaris TaxID=36166 RepID=T1GFH8_MEGSC
MKSCIFCDIAEKKSPDTVIEFENEELVIFKDIRPAAEHHFLAVPKVHFDINNLEASLKTLLENRGVDVNDALYGFHWPPFISVKHLHMHAMAPASGMAFKSRMIFRPNSLWFATDVGDHNKELLVDNLEKALKDLILSKSLNIDDAVFGFHVPPLISVWHLHLHALAPVSSIIPRARYKYTPTGKSKAESRAIIN